jgi:hypothetical protein
VQQDFDFSQLLIITPNLYFDKNFAPGSAPGWSNVLLFLMVMQLKELTRKKENDPGIKHQQPILVT